MKKTLKNFDLSDNLYYADQIGTIEDQLDFLDQLKIHEVQLYDFHNRKNSCMMVIWLMQGNQLRTKLIEIRPSLNPRIRFGGKYVVDIYHWLLNHGFYRIHLVQTFKPISLCEEDHSDGEEATVPVVD